MYCNLVQYMRCAVRPSRDERPEPCKPLRAGRLRPLVLELHQTPCVRRSTIRQNSDLCPRRSKTMCSPLTVRTRFAAMPAPSKTSRRSGNAVFGSRGPFGSRRMGHVHARRTSALAAGSARATYGRGARAASVHGSEARCAGCAQWFSTRRGHRWLAGRHNSYSDRFVGRRICRREAGARVMPHEVV